MLKNKSILLISPEAWGQNFVSKHLYAKYLSKDNQVYFLNPVSSSKINPLSNIDCSVDQIEQNLYSVNYKNLLPRLNNLPKNVQAFIYKKQARQIQQALNIAEFDIIWSFDPYRFWNLKYFKAHDYIYHSVDFHPGAKFESDCCKSADLVIAVADLIRNDLLTYRSDVVKIGHGADIESFSNAQPVQLPGANQLKACYVGNFHRDIDYSILLQLVSENTEVDFIMIGPTLNSNLSAGNQIQPSVLSKLETFDTIFFTGPVPADKIMGYLIQGTINLALFKKESEKIHCSPHKLMAYFYSGNITLSNYIDEHKSTDPDIILMKKSQEDIPAAFKEIKSNPELWNSDESKSKRRQFALKNSYANKISEIASLLYP